MKKRVLCKRNYNHFEIGELYNVELFENYLDRTHVCIDGYWFTEKGKEFIWPNLYDYFYDDMEERSIKLKVIDLMSNFSCQ